MVSAFPTRRRSVSTLSPQICGRTGLALVPSDGLMGFRIAKPSYGPLNPPLRLLAVDRLKWNRYDVVDGRTIYAASSLEGAYGESLASFRPALDIPLSDLFDDVGPGGGTLAAAVAADWANLIGPGRLPASWRKERCQFELTLPADGWMVDVEHAESISSVTKGCGPQLAQQGLKSFNVADLRGPSRQVTTTVATWVRSQVLEDGSRPHGIQYGSKLGSNWLCWAVWLRVVDDGSDPAQDVLREPTKADSGSEIKPPGQNATLAAVARQLQLHLF